MNFHSYGANRCRSLAFAEDPRFACHVLGHSDVLLAGKFLLVGGFDCLEVGEGGDLGEKQVVSGRPRADSGRSWLRATRAISAESRRVGWDRHTERKGGIFRCPYWSWKFLKVVDKIL